MKITSFTRSRSYPSTYFNSKINQQVSTNLYQGYRILKPGTTILKPGTTSISVNVQFLTIIHHKAYKENCSMLRGLNKHIYGQRCKYAGLWHVQQLVPVAQVKCEQMIFSLSGFRSTNILRMNSRAAIASFWGPTSKATNNYNKLKKL